MRLNSEQGGLDSEQVRLNSEQEKLYKIAGEAVQRAGAARVND